MNVVRYIFLLGLVGALTGCVTPEEMGYLATPEPAYTTPVTPVYSTTPVYNTSPSYYATPVSGYSTMTVYDGYHPGYGGPHYPHHGPPPPVLVSHVEEVPVERLRLVRYFRNLAIFLRAAAQPPAAAPDPATAP